MQENKRYAIYARVASAGQDEHKRLEQQTRLVQEHLEKVHSETSALVYTDCGYLGATINCPALNKLMSDAAKGEVDIVFCASADRLGRGETFNAISDKLASLGVEIVLVDKASALMHDMMMWRLLPR